MRRRRFSREAEVDPFYDMLFNMLIAFVFLLHHRAAGDEPEGAEGRRHPFKAEYIINVSWPDMNPNDIDTWVQDPAANLVCSAPARPG